MGGGARDNKPRNDKGGSGERDERMPTSAGAEIGDGSQRHRGGGQCPSRSATASALATTPTGDDGRRSGDARGDVQRVVHPPKVTGVNEANRDRGTQSTIRRVRRGRCDKRRHHTLAVVVPAPHGTTLRPRHQPRPPPCPRMRQSANPSTSSGTEGDKLRDPAWRTLRQAQGPKLGHRGETWVPELVEGSNHFEIYRVTVSIRDIS